MSYDQKMWKSDREYRSLLTRLLMGDSISLFRVGQDRLLLSTEFDIKNVLIYCCSELKSLLNPSGFTFPYEMNYRYVFSEFLQGKGIEIGALNNPFRVPARACVRYVDKFSAEELATTYPGLPTHHIRIPDIVCKTGELNTIANQSLDFIIASHVLEHADNPLHLLYAWHRKLKTGGLLLLVLPDSRFTFDRGRPLTSLEHLLWDFEHCGTQLKELVDLSHIAECNLNMHDTLDVDSALQLAKTILKTSRDTHFHVWNYYSFRHQLDTLISEFGLPYRIKRAACDERLEMLFLLNAVAASGASTAYNALGAPQQGREGFKQRNRAFSRAWHKISSLSAQSGKG